MQTATVTEIEQAERALQQAKDRLNALKYPSVGEWNGHPVIHLSGQFSFGLVNAALIVKNFDAIRSFVQNTVRNSK